ncbi:XAC0095 family protein [Dyella flava]|uniref:Uncharacterized protein n=1 Tax=Dyella flava TaxID=1920170 RepID=A0ABS2K3F7_9GAMM|nr:hypothetical protein [Dyella flava]MBM7125756.1 hypothetical protein [Dyella flava]GLQ48726.1 hypothetical protein GCM10010872_01750 [Dyella flava]
MDSTYIDPFGLKHYLLSEDDYIELKNLQRMLLIMAKVACKDDLYEGDANLIPRSEMKRTLELISRLIGEPLERLEEINQIEHLDRTSH